MADGQIMAVREPTAAEMARVRRGEEAKALLENALLKEALQSLETFVKEAFWQSDGDHRAAREELASLAQASRRFSAYLTDVIASGSNQAMINLKRKLRTGGAGKSGGRDPGNG